MTLTTTRITGTVDLPDGATPQMSRVRFVLSKWDKNGANIFVPGPVEVQVASDGTIEADLQTTTTLSGGALYDVTLRYYSDAVRQQRETRLGRIAVPATGPVALGTLLAVSPPESTQPDALAQCLAAAAVAEVAAEIAAPAASAAALSASQAALYEGVWLNDVAALLADTTLKYTSGPGQVTVGQYVRTRAEGYSFSVLASSASTYALATAGGVRLDRAASALRGRDIHVSSALDRFGRVRSLAGSDSNSGLTADKPLATLAAARALVQPGDRIWLMRGSYWRESLVLGMGFARGYVLAYGASGEHPMIDGADVVANSGFSKAAGYANIYDVTVPHTMTSSNQTFSVWRNGARLTRVTSKAALDSTPGAFYAPAPSGSASTISVHAPGSVDPSADGALYEAATRAYCLVGARAGEISGIWTGRQGHNDGSLISYDYAYGCVAQDGTKHNFFNQGTMERCLAYLAETFVTAGASTLFVAYNDVGTGKSARFIDCVAIGRGATAGHVGFYSHTAGATKHAAIIYERCMAMDCASGFAGANYQLAIHRDCVALRCKRGISNDGTTSTDRTVVLGGLLSTWDAASALAGRPISSDGGGGFWLLRGVTIVSRAVIGAQVYGAFADGIDIQNCDLIFADPSGVPTTALQALSASAAVTFRRNLVYGGAKAFTLPSGATLISDLNSFYPATMDAEVGGTAYTDIAAYKAGTSLDAASVVSDPLISHGGRIDKPKCSFASPVWAIGAGSGALSTADLDALFAAELAA
ncbi:hypothetical protein LV780_04940 [Cereibacter azotoformans]|uniref:hypothetical protein n=1 Tax=Cereibacter azotoformans TaxID=43057 RepID=UPI000E35D496|nr:hypothetical protein [Cereibacter azotoformans]AXQ93213.1 hypothetical protein D0Z66_04930 [Cereibacter sphaeroides]UIJ31527.1 hypothetical protein LV780_04940 [Cereibacter azotoformans]